MTDELLKLPACSFCWDRKHKCLRDPVSKQCRDCIPYIKQILLQGGPILADTLDCTSAHGQLYRNVRPSSLPTLDVEKDCLDRNIFGVQVTTSAGHASEESILVIDATFNTRTPGQVYWLDEIVRMYFTVDSHGKGNHKQVVEDAVLVGGYLSLLSSSTRVIENVLTTHDGETARNGMEYYNLHAHLQDFALDRLRVLMEETLNAVRFQDADQEHPGYTRAAHAAAVILHCEVDHFRSQLRSGHLFLHNLMPPPWKGPGGTIVKWLTGIEAELHGRLRQGCGQYAYWDLALSPKRHVRRKPMTFELKLTLHQIKHTRPKVPPNQPIFTPLGDGDVFLMSPPRSPLLKVLGLSSDALDVEEEIPVHVSYLALFDNSITEAETSDMDLDLFPDLQTIIR